MRSPPMLSTTPPESLSPAPRRPARVRPCGRIAPVRRLPLRLLTATALLLALTLAALWARSYFVHDWVHATRGGSALFLHSNAGSITVVRDVGMAPSTSTFYRFTDSNPQPATGNYFRALTHFHAGSLPGLGTSLVRFPHWVAILVAAAWPTLWLFLRRRRKRGFPVNPPAE